MRIDALILSTAVFFWMATWGQAALKTIGDDLEPAPHHETSAGQVALYAGSTFGLQGVVVNWTIVCSGGTNGALVPLLFEKINATDYVLRAMGAFRDIYSDGTFTIRFDPEVGEGVIGPNFTFGFADRVAYAPSNGGVPILTHMRYSGLVDYQYQDTGQWLFSSESEFELRPGQVFRLNGVTEGNIVGLRDRDELGRRSYSAQMTGSGMAAAAFTSIYGAVEICWPSVTGAVYQVESTGTIETNWQPLGEVVIGNGSVTCVFDSIRDGRKFYRVRVVP